MNVKPLSDRVLILPNPAEEKTAGGLIIPDTAKEKPLAGKVVAVGPGTSEVKMEVKEGDQIKAGQLLVVLEAMKMENEILAPHDGTVAQVIVSKGSTVETDSPLIVLA